MSTKLGARNWEEDRISDLHQEADEILSAVVAPSKTARSDK